MKKIIVTGKPARIIKVTGKPLRKIDPKEFAAAIGAELIRPQSKMKPVSPF